MKRVLVLFASICLTAMMLTSCSQKFPGYKKTKDGLYYKFHVKNPSAQKPNPTDFLKLSMACYLNDSLYFDWQKSESEVYAQLSDSRFPGDLQEAYSMMRVGDSASFYIKADSIALRYYEQDPAAVGLKPEDYFRYEVKLVDLKTQEEFKAEVEAMKKVLMEESKKALEDYVVANNITVTPEPSGLYIMSLEKGYGRCPEQGERVELDFAASLLNGKSVGSTFDQPEKFSFILGEGFTIKGWEEIVPKMHLGERVKAIIPFDLAYGEHAVGDIPAYSNLVYDIQLLKITTKEELKKEEEEAKQALKAESEKAFYDYLKDNNITECTPSGLYYSKSVVTDGAGPVAGQTARIKFLATYLDGSLLGDSDQLGEYYDVEYGKGTVLKGLEEGIGMMHVGEKARFVLPYTLAYGTEAYRNIPAFSNLVFDVELLDVIDEKK